MTGLFSNIELIKFMNLIYESFHSIFAFTMALFKEFKNILSFSKKGHLDKQVGKNKFQLRLFKF